MRHPFAFQWRNTDEKLGTAQKGRQFYENRGAVSYSSKDGGTDPQPGYYRGGSGGPVPNGTIADLYDGMLMKDMDKAVDLLKEKITEGQSIRIIGDYDIDGVNATYILLEGLTGLGARVD